jgi:hypothetical protein
MDRIGTRTSPPRRAGSCTRARFRRRRAAPAGAVREAGSHPARVARVARVGRVGREVREADPADRRPGAVPRNPAHRRSLADR